MFGAGGVYKAMNIHTYIHTYFGALSIFFRYYSKSFFSPTCLFGLPVQSHFKFGTVFEAAATAKKFVKASVWVMLS